MICKESKVIDATKFIKALQCTFYDFTDELNNKDFDSNEWKKVIKKIDHIVENCN